MKNIKYELSLIILGLFSLLVSCKSEDKINILDSNYFKHYIENFNNNDNEIYSQYIANDSAFAFLSKNIPYVELPDKQIEETYYFRWWTYRKHLKQTKDGFVITEFLPKVPWSLKHNTINCPAGHHIYEGRWLRNPKYITDYIDFWLYHSGEGIRQYSFWVADAVLAFQSVHKNDSVLTSHLPLLINNYKKWEEIRKDALNDVLFWQHDSKDGMELTASGRVLNRGIALFTKAAVRPTINSYMFGDAKAISSLANYLDSNSISQYYDNKAEFIKKEVQERLWNKDLNFFTVLPKNYTDKTPPVNVRELIGYIPWYFNLPDDSNNYSLAWEKVIDSNGFSAPHGLTTCERVHPFFKISYSGHECQWNGPSWPFATTQTLKGLANFLNNYNYNGTITRKNYFHLLSQYSRNHRIVDEEGKTKKWIDENMNPFTGDWISRTRLKTWNDTTWSQEKGGVERGKDYNHSGFCDLIISDLLGIKTEMNDQITINPLIPPDWEWFCLDNLLYQGKEITVIWDKTGKKYERGEGLLVFVNGDLKARSYWLEKITCDL